MNYSKLHKIKISTTFGIQNLIESIRNATSEYMMIADMSYQLISASDFDVDVDKKTLVVPQILPFSTKISNPFGRKIQHIALQPNLKAQPVMSGADVRPDFIPFAIIGHRLTLLRIVARCENTEDIFLELSLILSDKSYNTIVHNKWLAAVQLHDFKVESRARLVSKYLPQIAKYFELTEKHSVKHQRTVLINQTYDNISGFVKLHQLVNNQHIIITDSGGFDYECLKYGYTSFSTNPKVYSDYYFALQGSSLYEFADMHRTFTQTVLPDHNSPGPIFTPTLNPLGSFAVKQFSSSINFAPPFTNSSNNLLTVIEIILSCAPRKILVISNSIISDLVASGGNAEAIKRQTFLTRAIEFCSFYDIEFKVLGDLCQLS